MTMSDFNNLLNEHSNKIETVAPDIDRERLRDAYKIFHTENVIRPGDIVRHKRGCSIVDPRRSPSGQYIVLRVKNDAEVVWDINNEGLYGIKLDTYIGTYDCDGDFVICWSDSRRLEPITDDD